MELKDLERPKLTCTLIPFFDCFEIIAKQPFSFESVDYIKKGYRRCVCGSDSIFYKINHDIVEIMAIIGRQNLKSIL